MKDRPFYLRLISALSEKYCLIDFFFSYSGKISIGFKNNVMLEVDLKPEGSDRFFKVLDGVGYRYRYIGKVVKKSEGIDKFVSGLISLIHPYRNELIKTGHVIYIYEDYTFEPDSISDIIPFLSYEEKGKDSELLIRFTKRCNQACEFCSSPIIKEDPDIDVLKSLVLNLARKNRFQVTITGGEPTLRPEFSSFVEWVLINTKAPIVRIQTNAVVLSNKGFLASLPYSNRLQFFISLHSLDPKVYDIITSSKGQLDRAIKGIKNILDRGYDIIVNVVINRYNCNDMESYLKKFYFLFGKKAKINFSVLILPEYRNNLERYIVSYEEIVDNVLPLMEEYNIPIESLISSTHASIPFCYLPVNLARKIGKKLSKIKARSYAENKMDGWIKTEKCQVCNHNFYCIGLPLKYYKSVGL